MDEYLRERLVDIENAVGDVLKERGLRTVVLKEKGERHVVFSGDGEARMLVRVVFPDPKPGLTTTTWENATLEYDCYFDSALGRSGWKHFDLQAIESEDLDGTSAEILEHMRDRVTRTRVLDTSSDQPNVVTISAVAEFYEALEVFLWGKDRPNPKIKVFRDKYGNEALKFSDGENRIFSVFFTPESEKALLVLQGEKVAEYPSHSIRDIIDGVSELYKDTEEYIREYNS